jgi:predicted ester cyclase
MLRRGVLLFLILVISGSCLADEADNVRIAESMVGAINDRDLDRLDQFVSQNVVRQSVATAGVVVTNLAEFKAFLESDFSAVPDSVMKIDVIFGNQDYVAMRAVYSGTQSGQMGPFPPTGKRFELPYIGILKIDAGKISKIWVEWDNVFVLSQLGHLAPPTEP